MTEKYAILEPWAEADPIEVRGMKAPRLKSLAGKTIGLYASSKPISSRILKAFEKQVKEKFPTIKTTWWVGEGSWAQLQIDTDRKEGYKKWLNGVDAVVAAVGD
jgi:hypothetical protein